MTARGVLNVALVLLLGLVWAFIGVFHFDPERRNNYLLQDMVDSPAPCDQSASQVFADGLTLQSPPVGTVPRGFAPLPYRRGSKEEMARAGVEMHNPFARSDVAALARGRKIFFRDCALCHGPGGRGNGVIVKHGFPPSPSLVSDQVRRLADGAIFYRITYGGAMMPSYAVQVRREDRWKVILFLRTLPAS